MNVTELKLKQASAVLGVDPKDLQNLVQFKVLHPPRRESIYWFDNRLLLEAKVAFYLKESLGTSTEVLALFARTFQPQGRGSGETSIRLRAVPAHERPRAYRDSCAPPRTRKRTGRAPSSVRRVSGLAAGKKEARMEARVHTPFGGRGARVVWCDGVPNQRGDSGLPG